MLVSKLACRLASQLRPAPSRGPPPPRSVATILSIVRDVAHLMDAINASTAMHRLGKVVRRQREADPGGRASRAGAGRAGRGGAGCGDVRLR